jgi:hypothetical protein
LVAVVLEAVETVVAMGVEILLNKYRQPLELPIQAVAVAVEARKPLTSRVEVEVQAL